MKKWYKNLLSIILLTYAICISLLIWPELVKKIFVFLDTINLNITINVQSLLVYIGWFILALTCLLFIINILLPVQKSSIMLIKSEKGTLSLGNEGISSFIRTQLSGQGLSNISVNIKNTKNVKKFNVKADAEYKKAVISDLPRINKKLTYDLEKLLSGITKSNIQVNIEINKANKFNHKSSRVI